MVYDSISWSIAVNYSIRNTPEACMLKNAQAQIVRLIVLALLRFAERASGQQAFAQPHTAEPRNTKISVTLPQDAALVPFLKTREISLLKNMGLIQHRAL